MDHRKLTDLGQAIADGAGVDWDGAERSAIDPDDRDLLPHLRLVEQIAHLHANLPAVAHEPNESSFATVRLPIDDGAPVTWGPLTIIEKIGRGSFGDVYRARDPRLDRPVALKLLRHRNGVAPSIESAVIEEARLMARVRHPNVITVYGAERIDGRVGLWMEFIEGATLEQELQTRGPFPAEEIVAIGQSVARALGAVHRAGLLHRDVKAQNVMRDVDGRVVLTDFGAGRDVGGSGDAMYDLAGTPVYLAPEVLEGQPATVQTDLYSVGVLLYHLATGSFPVRGRSLRELRDAHARGSRRYLRDAQTKLRSSVVSLVDRVIDPDPQRRPRTASELEGELLHLATLAASNEVAGETLAARLRRGPVPLKHALSIGHQMAEALELAHARSVVCGMLATTSFKMTSTGRVKLVDVSAGAAQDANERPEGAYLSPEQQAGQRPDHRSDIWAFGCLLYELLSGEPAFPGTDAAAGTAGTPSRPDWSKLPSALPDLVRFVVHRSLETEPVARFASITDVRLMLEDAMRDDLRPRPVSSFWKIAAIASAVLLVGAATLAISPSLRRVVGLTAGVPLEPAGVSRVMLPVTTGHLRGNEATALSPDGTRLVYAVQEGTPPVSQLYVRSLDQFDATALAGTTAGSRPFFSPDGQWVGYFAGDDLMKVALPGAPPIRLCRTPTSQWGGAWGPNGVIVFASDQGLWRVSVNGGTPELFARSKPKLGEQSYRWPQVLPDGSVMFTVWKGPLRSDVAIVRGDGSVTTVIENASKARFLPPGFVIFGRHDTLLAASIDLEARRLVSTPVAMINGIRSDANGSMAFAISATGSLVYGPGALMTAPERKFAWLDRQGRDIALALPARRYVNARLSPDGEHLAAVIQEPSGDSIESSIWIGDPKRGTLTRLTFGGNTSFDLTWTPDGTRVTFRKEQYGLFLRRIDMSGPEEFLVDGTVALGDHVGEWSRDGETLLFSAQGPAGTTGFDLWTWRRSPAGTPPEKAHAFLQTAFDETHGVFSPDGRWVAYTSEDSGQSEVYVRPFQGTGSVVQISNGGGQEPHWRGSEILYEQPSPNRLMAVTVLEGSDLKPGRPRALFGSKPGQTFITVAPDGQQFLFLTFRPAPEQLVERYDVMRVVVNWIADVKRQIEPKSTR